jgi:predicted TIM-barrel fold metal-dependent hydrolase
VANGFAALAPSRCPVELTTTHENFGHVASLMERHPQVPVLLGHSGLPVQRDDDYFALWSKRIAKLAAETPALCKISALASGPDPNWTVDSIRRWFHTMVESFGPDRCMLGSNWPIDRQFGTYTALLDAYRQLLGELSPADAHAVASGTATRFYRPTGWTAAPLAGG